MTQPPLSLDAGREWLGFGTSLPAVLMATDRRFANPVRRYCCHRYRICGSSEILCDDLIVEREKS